MNYDGWNAGLKYMMVDVYDPTNQVWRSSVLEVAFSRLTLFA
jgi:hypothetical protein